MQTLLQDLRYGLRMLLRNPHFALFALLMLGAGIGANVSIFSLVNGVFLRPLAVKDPERLAVVSGASRGVSDNPVSYADFDEWRNQNQSFERMAAYFHRNLNFTGMDEPERLRVATVTDGYFDLLGIQPSLGRNFTSAEHQTGAGYVAIVSHGFWQRRFGGSSNLIGQSILLDGTSYTVVGVAPAETPSFFGQTQTEIWIPLEPNVPWRNRGLNFLTVIGRLRPGIAFEQAQAEMNLIAARQEQDHPQHKAGVGIRVAPLRERLFADVHNGLIMLLAAVALVLLIAITNVASLLLAHATGRGREFAIRSALGAAPLRLTRQVLAEGGLLGIAGGVLGALLAFWLNDLILAWWPVGVRRPDWVGIDWRVLSFTGAIAVLAGMLCGLAPAAQAAKPNLNESLKEGSSKATTGIKHNRIRGSLVVTEVALATMLVLGAGLMLKSFWLLRNVNPGFDPENVISVQISLPASRYREDYQITAFFNRILEGISAIPDVQAVGAVNNLPLAGGGMSGTFRVEGQMLPEAQEPETEKFIVSSDYFRAMGIRLLKGRQFSDKDTEGQPEIVVINESMANHFWPNEDPIGKRIAWGNEWQEIVGVVSDVKHEGLEAATGFQSYMSHLQSPSPGMAIVTRTSADPVSIAAAIRSHVTAIDKDQPVYSIRTLEEVLSNSVSGRRLSAFLVGIFAAAALLLAAVGIYGVIAFSVAQRSHEIGIRTALGAQAGDILKLVMRQGMMLVAIGILIGVTTSFVLMRLMQTLLFGVSATDPVTFGLITCLLTSVALLACWLPARRATKVDPIIVLRYE